jgi:hypothetical protein
MTRRTRFLFALLILAALVPANACNEGGGGIGMGAPPTGAARWGGGSSGPGINVMGGPAY